MPTHYAFLCKRPKVDTQAWPLIYRDKDLAEACFGRVSPVVPVFLEDETKLCPTCRSPEPHRHPIDSHCADQWHSQRT